MEGIYEAVGSVARRRGIDVLQYTSSSYPSLSQLLIVETHCIPRLTRCTKQSKL